MPDEGEEAGDLGVVKYWKLTLIKGMLYICYDYKCPGDLRKVGKVPRKDGSVTMTKETWVLPQGWGGAGKQPLVYSYQESTVGRD